MLISPFCKKILNVNSQLSQFRTRSIFRNFVVVPEENLGEKMQNLRENCAKVARTLREIFAIRASASCTQKSVSKFCPG